MLLACFTALTLAQSSSVQDTKHNLTASGPGTVKVGGGGESCRFCHTPHAANPIAPLWNREDPGTYYQTYESSTLVAHVPQPSGSSRLCLSCHDGTIALAQTYNSRNAPGGYTVYLSPQDRGYLGTDLSDDHPISFTYDSGLATTKGSLAQPAAIPPQLPLDHEGRLQCTTCHDPHDDSFGQFLRMDNRGSALCASCHQYDGWSQSAHATSGSSLSAAVVDSWDNLKAATVAEAGCESCHRPHSAGGRQRLLRHEAEDANCFNCHDGSVAQTNLVNAMNLLSTHPIATTTGVHDPTENPMTMTQHVECADCHNPHRASATGVRQAPFIQPALTGASGMNASGAAVTEARFEYEVCYKCHSTRNFARPVVDRYEGANNIAQEFSPTNASYHPVESPGINSNVPSLLPEYQNVTHIYCTDCHGSDNPNDAQGPHGSRYAPLLVNNYTTRDNAIESSQTYALCYQCHNRSSILSNQSYAGHSLHVVDQHASCATCHDPHGVERNSNLINFDTDVVAPAASGQGPTYMDQGAFSGSCTLSCHGKDHQDTTYGLSAMDVSP
ncbi:MAG: hypothetical protein IT445_05385 [Phycisphaeraceae bacterium]|nr:hypothetical protein [Phycisphaeraceae bacterium]